MEMKTYQLNKPILLTNNAAEQLGVNNRIYQVGELMEFPDEMAKAWLISGTVIVYEPPVPVVIAPPAKAAKKPAPKAVTKQEAK